MISTLLFPYHSKNQKMNIMKSPIDCLNKTFGIREYFHLLSSDSTLEYAIDRHRCRNGRGPVDKRVLQASLIQVNSSPKYIVCVCDKYCAQELRSMNLVVKVVKNRAGNMLFLLIRGPTLSEWALKVY